jgi:formate dehydrogenase beta subunit
MTVTRREALVTIAKAVPAAVGVAATLTATEETAHASEGAHGGARPQTAVGLLYDASKCIGCKACVSACAESNGIPESAMENRLWIDPPDLDDKFRNIIKVSKDSDGKFVSYVKRQCMHCDEPGCVVGCPFGALYKEKVTGVVRWDGSKCIGCRYCTVTCPFNIPKFQWMGYNPVVTKCELCSHKIVQGLQPGCTSVCPTGAVIFGRTNNLLDKAKQRIKDNPNKYFENRVYGETDNGGTQVLYLSHVPFDKLGLPKLGPEPVPTTALKWQKRAFSYMLLPGALYLTFVGMIKKRLGAHEEHLHHEEKKTGLKAQL